MIVCILVTMIEKWILQLIIGIAVGIYGYLVPGYINLSVLQLGFNKNKQLIHKILIIIAIIEIPYCFLCMSGMQWLMQQATILLIIKWLLVIMLFGLALLTCFEARKQSKVIHIERGTMDNKQINKFLFFAIFNPFQLSAWVIWGGYFIEKSWFSWTTFSILLFSIGACIGVFIILKIYALMGEKLIAYFASHRKYINYTVAAILLLLGILQLYKNCQ